MFKIQRDYFLIIPQLDLLISHLEAENHTDMQHIGSCIKKI